MDYKKLKELLLDNSAALTVENAGEILDLWENTPRTFYDFLRNAGAFVFLESYVGYNEENEAHDFMATQQRVPSPAVAAKFFRLEDDDLNIRFTEIVSDLAFKSDKEGAICAWPYLNKENVCLMSREFILELFITPYYVFDFSADEKGALFDFMRRRMHNEQEEELLAANSFNIIGWTAGGNSCRDNMKKLSKFYFLSSHAFNAGIGEEASFRKLFLRYIYDVEYGVKNIMREINGREQGFVSN